MRGKAPQQPIGEFRLLQGVGAQYANRPIVQRPSTYGIVPSSVAPMYDQVIRVGGGMPYNANRRDDISVVTNPHGIVPDLTPSERAIPSRDMFADRRVNYATTSRLPMTSADPSALQVPVVNQSRAIPNVQRADPTLRSILMPGSSVFASSSSAAGDEELEQGLSEAMELQRNPGTGKQLDERLANLRRGGGVF
jgi:hypothetical protein